MKQGICEMIPKLFKVIPEFMKSIDLKIDCFFISKHSNASSKAQTWQIVKEDVPKEIGTLALQKTLL